MLRFQHIADLNFLWVLPIIVVLFLFLKYRKNRSLRQLGDKHLISRLMPQSSNRKLWFKLSLILLAITALVIGLANPQVGSKLEKVEKKGIDIMIAVDVSNSMLAEDVKPNRLERSLQHLNRFVDKLENDRLGLVLFAGKAIPFLPMTHDYAAAKMFVSNIKSDLVATQGTSIADAIDLCVRSFQEGDYGKAIIIITDGEDHEGSVNELVKTAVEKGITIYTIGVGSPQGAPIPHYEGKIQVGFKKSRDGQTVISKLNESMLMQIAADGKGIFVRTTNNQSGLQRIQEELQKMKKTGFETQQFAEYDSRYYYFLLLALLLLIVELITSERRSKFFTRLLKWVPVVVLALIPGMLSAQSESASIRKGNRQYEDKKFKEAEIEYRKALEKKPQSHRGSFNLGNTEYRQDKFDEAADNFLRSASGNPNKSVAAKAYHNMGNALLKAQKLEESINAYKHALRLNPQDEDTRYNLAYAMRYLQQQQNQQQSNNQDNKKDEKQDEKNQQNQQQNDQKEQNPKAQQQKEQQQQRQLSKQEAERMLQALKEQEQKTLDKVQQKQVAVSKIAIEKDW